MYCCMYGCEALGCGNGGYEEDGGRGRGGTERKIDRYVLTISPPVMGQRVRLEEMVS